ncbi:hypothetical protein HHI36_010633, partial [Cryptolaemus montrouzieri]
MRGIFKTPKQKLRTNEDYNARNKEVRRCFRNEKRRRAEKLAEEAKKAANLGKMKKLYNTTRLLAN